MSDVVQLTAQLTVGPATTVDDSCVPTATSIVAPIQLTPAQRSAVVSTGIARRVVDSASAFVSLSGVGATDTVTQATFLYVRTSAAISLRVTFEGATDDVVSVIPVFGTLLLEPDPAQYVKGIEVQGVATVEWLATGDQ